MWKYFHEKCPFLFTVPLKDVNKIFMIFKSYFGIWDRVLDSYDFTSNGLFSRITRKNVTAEENPLESVSKDLDLI